MPSIKIVVPFVSRSVELSLPEPRPIVLTSVTIPYDYRMMWARYAEPMFAAYHLGDFNADLQLTEEYTHDISSDARHYRLSPHTLLIPGAGDRLVILKADATSPAKRKIVYTHAT
jgi:hypothetical protein